MKNDLTINMFNKGMNILLSKFREAFLSIQEVSCLALFDNLLGLSILRSTCMC